MDVTNTRPAQAPVEKVLRLTLILTEVQASLLVGLARHQANEAARLWRFAARNGPVAESTERRASTWEEITAILTASVEEAQEIE